MPSKATRACGAQQTEAYARPGIWEVEEGGRQGMALWTVTLELCLIGGNRKTWPSSLKGVSSQVPHVCPGPGQTQAEQILRWDGQGWYFGFAGRALRQPQGSQGLTDTISLRGNCWHSGTLVTPGPALSGLLQPPLRPILIYLSQAALSHPAHSPLAQGLSHLWFLSCKWTALTLNFCLMSSSQSANLQPPAVLVGSSQPSSSILHRIIPPDKSGLAPSPFDSRYTVCVVLLALCCVPWMRAAIW